MGKKVGILAVVAVAGFWFWVVANTWVHGDIKFALVSAWIWPLTGIVIASAIFGIALLILPDAKWRWLTGLCIALTMLVVFGATWLNGVGALAIIPLTAWAGKLIGIEARDHAKINAFLVMRRGLSWVILPLLIAVSFQYYQSPSLERSAEEAYANQVSRRALDALSYYAREYAPFLPPVLAFGLFIVLWGLAYVFIYLSILLGMLIFWVLRKTGFVKIEVVQIPSEFIKL